MKTLQILIINLIIIQIFAQGKLKIYQEYEGNVYKQYEGKLLVQDCNDQCMIDSSCLSWSVKRLSNGNDLCQLKNTKGNLVTADGQYSGQKSEPIKYYMKNYQLDTDFNPKSRVNIALNANEGNDPDVCQQRCLQESKCEYWVSYQSACRQRQGAYDVTVLKQDINGIISDIRDNFKQLQDATAARIQSYIDSSNEQVLRDKNSKSNQCTTLYSECNYLGQTQRFCERDIPISYINGPDFVTKSIKVHNEKDNYSIVKVVDGNNYYIINGSQQCIKGITAGGFKLVKTNKSNLVRQQQN